MLKVCNDVLGCKKDMKCNVNAWWWNSGVKVEKKEACKEMKIKSN